MKIEERLTAFGLGEDDLAAWQASEHPDHEFEDWLVDRVARRPTGARARQVYGAEDIHDFARRAILDALGLGPGAPEPIASHTHLYDDETLASLARQAGFTGVSVESGQLLTASK